MRIFFASQSFYPHIGGVSTYLLNLARELVKRGNEVTEIHLRPSGEANTDEVRGVNVLRVPKEPIDTELLKGYSKFKEAIYKECHYHNAESQPPTEMEGYEEYNKVNEFFGEQMQELLEEGHADIVHIHDFQLLFAYKYVPRGTPCILTWHIPFTETMSGPTKEFLIKHLIEYDKVVFSSQDYIDAAIKAGLPKEKTELIHPIANTELFRILKVNKNAVKEKYGIPKDSKVILCVQRVDPKSGHEQLIRALPLILKQVPNAKLVFVGGDSLSNKLSKSREILKNNILKLIDDLGLKKNIIWTGTIDYHNLAELYNSVDVVTLCSKNEGFGLTVTEGMACGNPIVGTRVGGIPIQVEDTQNGFLVGVGDIKSTAESIIKILKNEKLRESMAEKSFEIVDKKFKIERGIEKHMMLYTSLIDYKDEFHKLEYCKLSDFRAIITDLDRTITDEAAKIVFDPKDYNTHLLSELKNLNLPWILATGRTIHYVRKLSNKFKAWDCIVAENGAVIYFPRTKKTITTNTAYMKKAKKIIRELNLPGTAIGKIIASIPAKDEKLVKKKLGDIAEKVSFIKNVDEIMILPLNMDKGIGIRLALKYLNIDIDKTFVVGDGENDIDMFLNPGFKIALSNSHFKIKKLANEVMKKPATKGMMEIIAKLKG